MSTPFNPYWLEPRAAVPVDIATTAALVTEIQRLRQALAQSEQEPPPWWATVEKILEEYGLQAMDFVADFKKAMGQPEQEPVAWLWKNIDGRQVLTDDPDYADGTWTPLYTAPPKREWVGLTDEEGAEIWADAHDIDRNRLVTPKEIVRRIEAKLREKNT